MKRDTKLLISLLLLLAAMFVNAAAVNIQSSAIMILGLVMVFVAILLPVQDTYFKKK